MQSLPLPPSLAPRSPRPRGPLTFRDALHRHSPFRRLSPDALHDLEGRFRTRQVRRGTRITTRVTDGAALCLIQRGRVRALIEAGDSRRLVLASYGPGDLFGEPGMFDEHGQSGAFEAEVDCKLLLVSHEAMGGHLQQYPETATVLLMELSARMRHRNSTIRGLLRRDARTRLVHALACLARDEGRTLRCTLGGSRDTTAVVAVPRRSHRELSELVGIRRETVTRTLADLQRQRLVESYGSELLIAESLIDEVI